MRNACLLSKQMSGLLAAILLTGCVTTSTQWDKSGVSDKQKQDDSVQCGAWLDRDGRLHVADENRKRFEECMTKKQYTSVPVKSKLTPVFNTPNSDGIDDPEYRRSISRNASNVKVHSSCAGLFVPKIEKELFRNTLPVWNIYFLNNSQNRYNVSYDVTYRKTGKTYFGRYDETLSEERTVTVRAGKLIQLPVLEGTRDIAEIVGVDVFRCTK